MILERLKSDKQVLHAKGPFPGAEILRLYVKFLSRRRIMTKSLLFPILNFFLNRPLLTMANGMLLSKMKLLCGSLQLLLHATNTF